MGVPVVYRKTTEGSITTYDFVDAVEGLGYSKFYGIYQASGSAILNRNSAPSQTPSYAWSDATTTLTKQHEVDWDLAFAVPAIVGNGTLIVSCYLDAANHNQEATGRMDVLLYKVDASAVETLLAQASGSTISWSANTNGSHSAATKVTLPISKIKAGEKLRVTTQFWTKVNGGSACTWRLWNDGLQRGTTLYDEFDGTTDLGFKNETDLIVTIPFKIDL